LHVDAEIWKLRQEIERARLLIKDNMFDFTVRDRKGAGEDHHHDEWPLVLDNWWTVIDNWGPGSTPSAVLAWEDVQASEDEYVEALSTNLDTALKSVRS
jgi:hypothetical protein